MSESEDATKDEGEVFGRFSGEEFDGIKEGNGKNTLVVNYDSGDHRIRSVFVDHALGLWSKV